MALFAAGLVATAALARPVHAPAPTLLLGDRDGRFLGAVGAGRGRRARLLAGRKPPPRVVAATLALEDRRFWITPASIRRARPRAVQNLRGRRVSGASTLAMQVARMQHPGRAYLRKVIEALTAVLLTARYGRDAVLAQYLRSSPTATASTASPTRRGATSTSRSRT